MGLIAEGGEGFLKEWMLANADKIREGGIYPGRTGIIAALGIRDEEVLALGLIALAPHRLRERARRVNLAAQGLNSRGKPRVRANTDTAAAEAAAAGISRATLYRQRKAAAEAAKRAQEAAEAARIREIGPIRAAKEKHKKAIW